MYKLTVYAYDRADQCRRNRTAAEKLAMVFIKAGRLQLAYDLLEQAVIEGRHHTRWLELA